MYSETTTNRRGRRGARLLTAALAAMVTAAVPTFVFSQETAPPKKARPPAVSGRFYSSDPAQLKAAVSAFNNDAKVPEGGRPLALVVPHAGFIYSGQIAADAWRQTTGHSYDVVLILGPNHTVAPFDGAAPWKGDYFLTPLGPAEIDRDVVNALQAADPEFAYHDTAHDREHSIEVQLPFLQVGMPGVKFVPLVVGGGDDELLERLGRSLARVLAERKPLIVASSDLSHYPAYEAAVQSDRRILDAIATFDPARLRRAIDGEMRRDIPGLGTAACGEKPIFLALAAAKKLGATQGRVISYANSGDTVMADRSRVVGYGAVAFTAGEKPAAARRKPENPPGAVSSDRAPELPTLSPPIGDAEREELLVWARTNIERYMETGTAPLARTLSLACRRKQGVFVTLTKDGQLRGCVGRMVSDLPVGQAVGAMALQAAFNDRRFRPLQPSELNEIEIEISLLTPLATVPDVSEWVLGRDGIRLIKQGASAVYLPKVAVEQGWNREETLEHLCQKAGLPADCWQSDAAFYTFQAEVFSEHPIEPPT